MSVIVGIDEVGRGAWAGPLVVGAVILDGTIAGLTDSKLLSKLQREKLAQEIEDKAEIFGLGVADASEVDRLGLTRAIQFAMKRALKEINTVYDVIVIDGNYNFLAHNPKAICKIKADLTEPAVSAASIIAKVWRDNYMTKLAKQYPNYGFEKHVGYGTALHREMLKLYGITEFHRKSYKPIQAFIGASV